MSSIRYFFPILRDVEKLSCFLNFLLNSPVKLFRIISDNIL